ncbi:MAG: hypothetical protein AB7I41_24970 [Candidatus Sericytochromatia bacterium]
MNKRNFPPLLPKTALIIGLLLLSPACALAQENPQEKSVAQELLDESVVPALKPMPGIWIDWRKRRIHAFGRGFSREDAVGPQMRLLALRAAKADALRRLAALIYGIHLEPGLTIDLWGQSNPDQRKLIEGLIKGAQEAAEPEQQPDGSYEIQLVLPLAEVEALTGKHVPYQ